MLTQPPDAFQAFPKLARLSRECIITEKIDGTNAQVLITEEGQILPGSRTRWITPGDDNFGFARWVLEHQEELLKLGPGRHFGEWWGKGIQRGYGLSERRLSLFNVARWENLPLPACVGLVPVLYRGIFSTVACDNAMSRLISVGSIAAPGFNKPEGIVCFHVAANAGFKKTLEHDEAPKSALKNAA